MTGINVDIEAINLVKLAQKVILKKNGVNLDLKDIVFLAFKRPDKVVQLINENFAAELDKCISRDCVEYDKYGWRIEDEQ